MRLATRLLLAAGLMSANLRAQTRTQTVTVSPAQAESNTAFTVTLSGKTALCNPRFSNEKAVVEKNALHLSVMAVNDPVAKCVAGDHDYALDFDIPALKAGSYEVNVYLQPACMYANPACLIAPVPDYGGKLEVEDVGAAYRFTPASVKPAKAFDLFLTSRDYDCGNEFSNLNASVQGYGIILNFTNRSNPAAICPAIVKDYGPTFHLSGLTPGVYQVFAAAQPYCDPKLACPAIMIMPRLAGALTVAENPSGLQGIRNGGNAVVPYREGALRIGTRGGITGLWRGEPRDVNGRKR
jgi:hypothetical protein